LVLVQIVVPMFVGIVVEVFLFCCWCFPRWCNFSTTPE